MHVDNLQFAGMVFKFVSVQHPPSRCIGLQLSRTEQYSNRYTTSFIMHVNLDIRAVVSQSGSEGILGDLKDVSRRPWNIEGWSVISRDVDLGQGLLSISDHRINNGRTWT